MRVWLPHRGVSLFPRLNKSSSLLVEFKFICLHLGLECEWAYMCVPKSKISFKSIRKQPLYGAL